MDNEILTVIVGGLAPLLAVGSVGFLFGLRDQQKVREREARCKAAGREFYWAEGGGSFAVQQCNCSKCGGWTPLHGPCRCCKTENP